MALSRAHAYTLAELKQESVAAVLVRATRDAASGPADEQKRTHVPSTVTRVQVRDVLWGTLAATSIAVRQFGTAGVGSDDAPPVLAAGRDYVLLVKPFEFRPGVPTGQYYVTGDAGVYDATDPTNLKRLSPNSPLPREVSSAALAAQLRS